MPYNGGVTRNTKIALINERIRIQKDIAELRRTIREIGVNGYSNASFSTSGGSKSYTRMDLKELNGLLADWKSELVAVCRRIAERPARGIGFAQIGRC